VWSGRETEGEREGLQLQRSKGFKEERRGQITGDEREREGVGRREERRD
jgi:hypothetical protein